MARCETCEVCGGRACARRRQPPESPAKREAEEDGASAAGLASEQVRVARVHAAGAAQTAPERARAGRRRYSVNAKHRDVHMIAAQIVAL